MRILTGTYLPQVHRKKFRMEGTVDACCPLCYIEDEDLVHMKDGVHCADSSCIDPLTQVAGKA